MALRMLAVVLLALAAAARATDVDCVVSEWAAASECSVTCGGGVQLEFRTILQRPAGDGRLCPALDRRVACGTEPCEFCTGGRVFASCARDCIATCSDREPECSRGCQSGRCQCPDGQVLNVGTNQCVSPRSCPATTTQATPRPTRAPATTTQAPRTTRRVATTKYVTRTNRHTTVGGGNGGGNGGADGSGDGAPTTVSGGTGGNGAAGDGSDPRDLDGGDDYAMIVLLAALLALFFCTLCLCLAWCACPGVFGSAVATTKKKSTSTTTGVTMIDVDESTSRQIVIVRAESASEPDASASPAIKAALAPAPAPTPSPAPAVAPAPAVVESRSAFGIVQQNPNYNRGGSSWPPAPRTRYYPDRYVMYEMEEDEEPETEQYFLNNRHRRQESRA